MQGGTQTSRVYRLSSFGLNKQTLKRISSRGEIANEEYSKQCDALLSRRGEEYTLAELELLNDMTYRAHHDCVLDNPLDYHRLEVSNTRERVYQHALRTQKVGLYRLNEKLEAAGHSRGGWTVVKLAQRGFQPAFWGGTRMSSVKHDKQGLMVYQHVCTKCNKVTHSDIEGIEIEPCTQGVVNVPSNRT